MSGRNKRGARPAAPSPPQPAAADDAAAQAAAAPAPAPAPRRFVVGIGSSAGGLEALTQLISHLPPDLGIPFVIAQHLSPTHRSLLVQLIARESAIAVCEVTDGVRPAPDTIYITPSNSNVQYRDGQLNLVPPQAGITPRPSVNLFFSSLAEELGDDAIGIILSGTGTDGAAGIRSIKAAGGFTLAQQPASAKYTGMPQAAIDTGSVDWVLTPSQIAEEISLLVRSRGIVAAPESQDKAPATLKKLLLRVRQRTKIDFTGYKESTLWRRIERRLLANHLSNLDDYLRLTSAHPEELDRLGKDILISVTSFFRDRPAFDRLRGTIEDIASRKRHGEEIRVWVPGCATGEEAYTIAILLAEILRDDLPLYKVQIFATDIDSEAMAVARRGAYPKAALGQLEDEIVLRYFSPIADGFEVSKRLRELIVFARQDLLQDPPFLRLDLISCRNLLIYFQTSLQDAVMPIFHYALNPGGYLFLGKSEGVYSHGNLFEVVAKDAKIFRRKGAAAKPPNLPSGNVFPNPETRTAARERSAGDILLAAASRHYLPATVMVNGDFEVLHTFGDTSPFLEFPSGRPSLNLMDAVRKPWRVELQSLLHHARTRRTSVFGRPRADRKHEPNRAIRLAVHAFDDDAGSNRYLVCFEPMHDKPEEREALPDASGGVYRELQDELASTREHLQTVIEELETSNEEMQALNEELQAANEELQSTNEELETSNEELQSTNEELTTVNDELQIKANELADANTDLENIHNSVSHPLLVVCELGHVTRANDPAMRLFGLSPNAMGRPLRELPIPYGIADLPQKAEGVLRSRVATEEHLDHEGRNYLLRISPCPMQSRATFGATISLVDTTSLTAAQRGLRSMQARLLAVMNSPANLVVVKDLKGRYEFVNAPYARLFGLEPADITGKVERSLLPAEAAALLRERDLNALDTQEPTESQDSFTVGGATRHFLSTRFPLVDEQGDFNAVCTIATDITTRVQADERLRESEVLNTAILNSLDAHVAVLDRTGHIMKVNDAWHRFVASCSSAGQPKPWVGSNYLDTWFAPQCASGEHARRAGLGIGAVLEGRHNHFVMEYPCHSGGEERWFLLSASTMNWDKGGAVVAHTPITDRVKMESELRNLNQELERRVHERTIKLNASNKELEAFAYSVSHDLQTPLRAIAGFSQALVEDYRAHLDEQGRRYLDRIINASHNMSNLIDDLLDLSRLARSELHLEAVDLAPIAAEVCDQLRSSDPGRNAEFSIANRVPVQGDPRLLRVMLDNLLGNAWKFSAPRPVSRIEFDVLERDGVPVCFVRDNGVGFDMNFKDKLFLPFQRLHGPSEFEGNGIGLANVARVVRLHGGEVWAESTLGYGATFYFTLDGSGAMRRDN